jgi:hypothetical protein
MDEAARKTALRMIPYGLQVLGAKEGDKITLATVNWTTQVSFKPPLVVVGVKGDSGAHGMVKNGKVFTLSFLGTGQKDQAFAFFKHVEPEGGKLGVYAYCKGGDLVIEVQDTGVGIPADVKPKLFTPMFTTKSKGQGFGLAVVKRVTESMNGTISFESEKGRGTKFILRFPPPKELNGKLAFK